MSTRNILIVEDDPRISRFIEKGLQKSGLRAEILDNAEAAEEYLRTNPVDVVLLDLVLPGQSGLDFCRRVRADGLDVPILMLTAMDAVADRVEGLRAGADDYLTKPFAFDELLARVEALLRRVPMAPPTRLEFADIALDLETMTARRADAALTLTPKEFRLLEFLLRNRGKVCSREAILENVWQVTDDPLTNVVEVYISHLRQKVDARFDVPLIQTVRGFGYKLDRPD